MSRHRPALDGYLSGPDRVTVLWVPSALLLGLVLANGLLKNAPPR